MEELLYFALAMLKRITPSDASEHTVPTPSTAAGTSAQPPAASSSAAPPARTPAVPQPIEPDVVIEPFEAEPEPHVAISSKAKSSSKK